MAVSNYSGLTIGNPQVGIQVTKVTDSSADWGSVANSTYFYDKTDKVAYYKDGSGNVLSLFSSSGGSSGKFGIADSSGVYTYYSTLTAAITAASAGQTVEFFTDYTETGAVTITLKDGVTINGNGHTYTLNNSGINNSFEISTSGTYLIYNLTVKRTGSTTSSNTQNLPLYCSANDVQCYLTASIFIGSNSGGSFFNGALNLIKIKDGSFYGLSRFGLLVYGNYTSTPNFAELENVQCVSESLTSGNGGSALYVVGANVYKCTGRASYGSGIYTDTVNLSNSYGFSNSWSGILCGPSSFVNQCYGQSYGRFGIEDGEIKNSTGVSTANVGIYSSGYIFNSTGKSSASGGILAFTSAANCVGYSTSNYGFGLYNGNNTADNCTSISTASSAFTTASGISPSTVYNNCVFNCKWNNSSGHAVIVQSNNVIFANCVFSVVNSSANCLNAVSPYTVKYAQNTFEGATTPVNANITQGIVNTEDNQGNILI